MNINEPLGPTHKDLLVQLRDEPYAWPGGYPKYAVTDDCAAICSGCAKDEFDRLDEAEPNDGFYIAMLTVNWEDNDLYCDHCNDRIESAYGEDESEADRAAERNRLEYLREKAEDEAKEAPEYYKEHQPVNNMNFRYEE